MEALKAAGKIAAWGITGIGVPTAVLEAIGNDPRPDVVQAIANLMDSPGALKRYAEPARPRAVAAAAKAAGCGVMGIRAVQAGALTAAVDRDLSPNSPDRADYDRAAGYRALCAGWGEDPAYVAHRYALSMPNIDTVVLGVKNRAELAQCVRAEADRTAWRPRQIDRDRRRWNWPRSASTVVRRRAACPRCAGWPSSTAAAQMALSTDRRCSSVPGRRP
jgi:aryl-alcohol dehydrogenase-like predicted oxidoreductase